MAADSHHIPSLTKGQASDEVPPEGEKTGIFARFDFDLADATFSRAGDDLTVTLILGETRVFEGFFRDEAALEDAVLQLADGTLVSFHAFTNLVDIETATGHRAQPSAPSGGAGDYADASGALITGLTRLDADKGMDRWSAPTGTDTDSARYGSFVSARNQESPGSQAGPGESAEPGAPGESEGDGYTARAVLYHSDSQGQGTAVFRLLQDGSPVDAQGTEFQTSSLRGYVTLPPVVNEDGTLSLTLSDAGREALASGAGRNIYDYITFELNGREYTMQVVVNQDGNYDAATLTDHDPDAPAPGAIAAEWHTDVDGGACGERATGDSNDEVRISSDAGTGFAGGSFHTGDGNNVMNIEGAASAVSGAALSAGSGDDLFILNGRKNYGLVNSGLDAGDGNNTLSISGGYMGAANAEIITGNGNDSITLTGGTSHGLYNSSILAGDGDNVITAHGTVGASNSVIKTGSGNDSITLTGTWTYGMESGFLDAGDGHNTLSITGLSGTNGNIRTGSGNDSITITGTGSQGIYGQSGRTSLLDAGDGDNVIRVSGTVGAHYAVITSGSGNDTVNLTGRSGNGLNLSSLDVGDGDNLTEINGSLNGVVSSSIVSGMGDDTFFIGSTGGSGMQSSSLFSAGGDNEITVQARTYGLNASSITLGEGDDLVSVSASGPANASAIYAAGNASSSIHGSLGHDVLYLDAASTGNGKAYGMHGLAYLSVTGMEEVNITAHSNGGDAYGMFAQNGAVNSIHASDESIMVIIKAMAGATATAYAMYASGGVNVIRGNSVAGDPNGDSVQLHGNVYAEKDGSNRIETGSGNDRISLDGEVNAGGLYLNAGDGFDVLALTAASSDEFNARYRDWLTDLDAKGLMPGMSIESIRLHGVAGLDSVSWLLDLAQRHGIELVLENGQSMDQSAAPDISALSLDALFADFDGYDGPSALEGHSGHESQYLFSDAVHASGGEHAAPDVVSFASASCEEGADHSYLFTLTNGVTM